MWSGSRAIFVTATNCAGRAAAGRGCFIRRRGPRCHAQSPNLRAAVAPSAAGKVMNVGTGASVTLNQLIGELELILGRQIEPVYADPRAGDVRESQADISLLRATLGWAPGTSLHDGLRHAVRAFAEHAHAESV